MPVTWDFALQLVQTLGVVIVLPGIGIFAWAWRRSENRYEGLSKEMADIKLKMAEEYTPLKRHLDAYNHLSNSLEKLGAKIDRNTEQMGEWLSAIALERNR